MATLTSTAETGALQRLMAWLSPAFPVGAFAYSAGLEAAISEKTIGTAAQLFNWLEGSLRHGSARLDAIILAEAHRRRGDSGALRHIADYALAITPSYGRHNELLALGNAFIEAAAAWPCRNLDKLPRPCPYPVAVGAIASGHRIGIGETLTAFLTAYVQSQISVAIRLVPLGQSDGLRTQAALEKAIADCAADAGTATLTDLGGIGYASDIAAMRHETLTTRIFRS